MVPAAGTGGGLRRLQAPSAAGIGARLVLRGGGQPARTLQLARRAAWGGTYTAGDADVTIYVSDSYAPDDALARRWTRFLGGLVHGPELSGLTLYLAPPSEVARDCPDEAIGDASAGIAPEAVVAHEYGHYVASYRENTPWDAVAWVTKRWASYENVCSRAARGLAFPGEEGAHYALNPGEAFAEAYRMLNAASAVVRWALVAPSLATPLGGPIELTAPAGADVQARTLAGPPLHLERTGRVLRGTVCGTRSLEVSLSRPASLSVSEP